MSWAGFSTSGPVMVAVRAGSDEEVMTCLAVSSASGSVMLAVRAAAIAVGSSRVGLRPRNR